MKLKDKITIPSYTLIEELINAISHGIGIIISIVILILCVNRSVKTGNELSIISSSIYGLTSIILYSISTIYHALKINNGKRILRILDHCSIYLLIAGTYTPYALIALPKMTGWIVFGISWGCAIIGIILNSINLIKYKKISMILYLLMGWIILFTLNDLFKSVAINGIILMFLAGIIYTIGTIFYGLGKKKKYMHSIFHILVLVASLLFFFSIYLYVIK